MANFNTFGKDNFIEDDLKPVKSAPLKPPKKPKTNETSNMNTNITATTRAIQFQVLMQLQNVIM